MLFGKKNIDLKGLKEENPEAYNKVLEEAKVALGLKDSEELEAANRKIAEISAKSEKDSKNAKITLYGEKLKVPEAAKEAIEKDMSFADALVYMTDKHIEDAKDIEESFNDTAANSAGTNIDDETDEDASPKSFSEAILFISKRDGITKEKASKKAQEEYPDLFKKNYE